MRRPSVTKTAILLAATFVVVFGAVGCQLCVCDDPCPPTPVYYVPAPPPGPPAPPPPGRYIYAPGPAYVPAFPAPRPGYDVSVTFRGQEPTDDFPTLGEFPTIADDVVAPPEESELPELARNGANVAEPTGSLEHVEEFSQAAPKRESIADVEEKEHAVDEKYQAWLKKQKKKSRENAKTPRYLQPIDNSVLDDENGPFARVKEQDDDKNFMRRVTDDAFSMMVDSERSNRELEEWEKETPTPVDWSKYAIKLDTIRGWFGMGPDEQAALEYMRRACLKQKEYEKSKDRKTLKEAAQLYEKAAERWPGPALRPREAKKNPFSAPKSGTLIEEDGLFFAGECWFFYKDFSRAVSCYRALVSTYASTIYKDVAMKRLFYIGNYWIECSENEKESDGEKGKPVFRTFAAAKKAYETIFLNDASDRGLAPAALFALANAYMRRGVKQGDGSYDNAAQYYRQLYELYPGSKYAEDAVRLRMIALHRSYQGEYYDAGPLEEAGRLAETILKSGRGNMDVVYEELENIKEEQAKRLYTLGQYYERRGNYASARNYYNRLVREHPNTEYASIAAQAYEKIESKPAEADELAWIRPVVPFLPKSQNEYFEEAPDAKLSQIARRDDRLNDIGTHDRSTDEALARRDSDDVPETQTAESPSGRLLK